MMGCVLLQPGGVLMRVAGTGVVSLLVLLLEKVAWERTRVPWRASNQRESTERRRSSCCDLRAIGANA